MSDAIPPYLIPGILSGGAQNNTTSSGPYSGTSNATGQNNAASGLNSWIQSNPYPATSYNPSLISNVQQVNPAMSAAASAQSAQLGPTATFGGANLNTPDLSSQDTIQQILNAYKPVQTQQQGQLNDQLAAAGLQGGPAEAAQINLANNQTNSLGTALASAIQNSQANQLGAAETQAGYQQQAGLANQTALNSAAQTQAGYNQQTNLANQSAQQQTALANQDASNNSQNTNAAANNAANATNVGINNTAQQQQIQDAINQWMTQFSAFNSINDAGLNTQNNISASEQNTAGQYADPTSGLVSAIGQIYSGSGSTGKA